MSSRSRDYGTFGMFGCCSARWTVSRCCNGEQGYIGVWRRIQTFKSFEAFKRQHYFGHLLLELGKCEENVSKHVLWIVSSMNLGLCNNLWLSFKRWIWMISIDSLHRISRWKNIHYYILHLYNFPFILTVMHKQKPNKIPNAHQSIEAECDEWDELIRAPK